MTKVDELQQKLEGLKAEAKAFVEDKNAEGAKAKMKEITDIKALIEIEMQLEQEEVAVVEQEIQNKIQTKSEGNDKIMNKLNMVEVFNKAIRGGALTEEEAKMITTTTGGAPVVPEEFIGQINELRRHYVSLKDEVQVIPAHSNSGRMPIEKSETAKLINFDECTEITKSDIALDQVTYKVASKGCLVPLSNELVADEKANLLPFINKIFAKRAVRTENADIITVMKTATKKTATDHKTIVKAINTLDPSCKDVIVTNGEGFDYLDNLYDSQGRPLLTDSLTQAGAKMFKGMRVVVVPTAELASETVGKVYFYAGSLKEAIAFFDRQQVEIARSDEAGFTTNSKMFRAIERYDVKPVDLKAETLIKIEVTPAV